MSGRKVLESIDKYIASLLQEHDCVVIPDFGGFVLNPQPASFGHSNELKPATKAISFNKSLTLNDGLLAQHVSISEKIGYTAALSNINAAVENWKTSLNYGEAIVFDKVGSLKQNFAGKIIFTPDSSFNFLKSSYGLVSLQLVPVEAAKSLITSTAPSTRRVLAPVAHLPHHKEHTGIRLRAMPAASIAASLLIALFIFFKNSSIDPAEVARVVNHSTYTAPIAKSIDNIITSDTRPASQTASIVPEGLKYYVIGGSFSREKNAKKFAHQLEQKGFKAQVLYTENGFFRVAYYNERDSLSAEHYLENIKIQENQSAWLLKW